MKSALLLALLFWQANTPPHHQNFRYQRTILQPAAPGPACAILDPALFPHAGALLKDLRLFDETGREIPYAITLSEPQQPDADPAAIRNLSLRQHTIVFDLEMPRRLYTDVTLNLAARDFIATATVSGTRDSNYTNQTSLGVFTLFDLTSQHLSRSTTLHLQETDLPYLHIELALSPAPAAKPLSPQALLKIVQGVTVPPSREAQSLYTTAAISTDILQRNRQSVAAFLLPERIPIERVSFDLDPAYKSNFSRDIHIADRPNSQSTAPSDPSDSLAQRNDSSNHASTAFEPGNSRTSSTDNNSSETLAGTIDRIHLTQSGREIRQQQLSVPATLGSNMQSPATVQIAIDNGDDIPLPLTAIRLETRQRKLCFDDSQTGSPSQTASPLTLYYGDPALAAPQYDFARLWTPSATLHIAQLGPEQLNPAYRIPPDARPLTERYPRLLWIVLLAVIAILATIAIRSSKTIRHS